MLPFPRWLEVQVIQTWNAPKRHPWNDSTTVLAHSREISLRVHWNFRSNVKVCCGELRWKPNSLAPRPILLLLCKCSFGSWPGLRDFGFFNIFQLHSNRQNLVQLLILTAGFTIRDNPAQCPSGELHCKVSELWYQMASLRRTCERVRDLNPFLLKTLWNFKEFKVCTLAWHGH